ncbi:hypothetical protein EV424DRAFT_1534614 [Suillus variegatus]|nr:hypothetical protein EV424DRAFT_1534614 [Suillus variegatus]
MSLTIIFVCHDHPYVYVAHDVAPGPTIIRVFCIASRTSMCFMMWLLLLGQTIIRVFCIASRTSMCFMMWLLLLGQTIIRVFCTASRTSMCFMMGILLGSTVVQFFHIASHTRLQRRQTDLVAYQDLTEVEARINQLTGAVQELKETRNSLTPLFKLPVELVVVVLSLLVVGDEPDAYSLVSCSQVCRRMRQICLEYPSLWRDAMNMSACPKFMEMILQRSAPLPFSIAIDFAQWNTEDLQMPNCATNLSLIVSALHRLNDFHIHASPSIVSALLSRFPHRAPALETLYLGVSRMMGDSDHVLQVPDTLMMLDAPLLRKLCLYGCIFSWDKFAFTNLVELRVVGFPDEVKPSLTAVLSVLSNLPLLQTLVMREVLLKLDNIPEQHAEPVQLPCLQSLCIHCPAMDCAIFLDAVATKELKVLDLVCQDTTQYPTAAEMTKFYSSLRVKTRAMDVRSVSMHCDFNNIRLIGSTFTDANCEDVQALISRIPLHSDSIYGQRRYAASLGLSETYGIAMMFALICGGKLLADDIAAAFHHRHLPPFTESGYTNSPSNSYYANQSHRLLFTELAILLRARPMIEVVAQDAAAGNVAKRFAFVSPDQLLLRRLVALYAL